MWKRLFWSWSAAAVDKSSRPYPLGGLVFRCHPLVSRPPPPPSSSSDPTCYFCRRRRAAAVFPFSSPTLASASCSYSSSSSDSNNGGNATPPPSAGGGRDNETLSCTEAKRLMRLVNVEALKGKLGMEGKEVIPYDDLLAACRSMGVARSSDEAIAFARVLDDAGVVLLFRDKVYLHPDKVVDLIRRAVPLALTPENDPMRDELKNLREKKEEIDVLAHRQVRRILWGGLGLAVVQVGLFFRLTFWEFSWDVMEPIAFFTTTTGIVIGYAYFLFTARDPTYQDLMKSLFLSRQRKLFKKHNFNVERLKELQCKCKTPFDASTFIRNRTGMELELDDSFSKD
ncbi:unnamed protein product [Linum trigynum]|uniref:Calcium uniporter protein C-terminal domain-containing protein n=1 Tax=Linum trigynum TaxID=586398 RepID=A0AAV2GMA2_9ROSI